MSVLKVMFRVNSMGVRDEIGVTFVKNPLCARSIRMTVCVRVSVCAWGGGS